MAGDDIDLVALGRLLGELTKALEYQQSSQQEFKKEQDAFKAEVLARLDRSDANQRSFETRIDQKIEELREEFKTDIGALTATIGKFKWRFTMGKVAVMAFAAGAGAVLVAVALGFKESIKWLWSLIA